MPRADRVLLADVAAVAGVSIATASKALNGTDRVSSATRARVLATARRLGFEADPAARSLVTGRSGMIGVLVQQMAHVYATEVMIGAVRTLGDERRAALLVDVEANQGERMRQGATWLRSHRVDAVLVLGDGPERRFSSATGLFDVPVTYAFLATDSPDDVSFLPDDEGAGRLAAAHLCESGRQRIAHVTGAPDGLAVQRREAGLVAGLAAREQCLAGHVRHGAWSAEWGARAMAGLIDSGESFDAIFCGNDLIAVGVLAVCAERGVRVPDDVAVVGVDNWHSITGQPDAARLTTIDLQLRELGSRAAHHAAAPTDLIGEHLVAPSLRLGRTS